MRHLAALGRSENVNGDTWFPTFGGPTEGAYTRVNPSPFSNKTESGDPDFYRGKIYSIRNSGDRIVVGYSWNTVSCFYAGYSTCFTMIELDLPGASFMPVIMRI
jgi:hypothetical protein